MPLLQAGLSRRSPVLSPATLTGHGQRVMGTSPRTIAVTVPVKDRLELLLQQHRCRGLGNPVCRVRGGGFILPLLQLGFGFVG